MAGRNKRAALAHLEAMREERNRRWARELARERYPLGMGHYILEGRAVVAAPFMEWAMWFEHAPHKSKIVAQDAIDGRLVSTVFLGLDHRFPLGSPGEPLIFETMVFDGLGAGHDVLFQCRWSTYSEAEAGHAYTAILVRAKRAPFFQLVSPSDTGADA